MDGRRGDDRRTHRVVSRARFCRDLDYRLFSVMPAVRYGGGVSPERALDAELGTATWRSTIGCDDRPEPGRG
jgi:hypothetical protein